MGNTTESQPNEQGMERAAQFVKALAAESESLTWESLAACRGWPLNYFFDWYEEDEELRSYVDERCYTCPVQQECGLFAKRNKKEGVWGGVYWTSAGKIDQAKNSHKTNENWNYIQSVFGEELDV